MHMRAEALWPAWVQPWGAIFHAILKTPQNVKLALLMSDNLHRGTTMC